MLASHSKPGPSPERHRRALRARRGACGEQTSGRGQCSVGGWRELELDVDQLILGCIPRVLSSRCRRPSGRSEPLLERGADLNWAGYDDLKPLEASLRVHAGRLAEVARRPRRQIDGGHLAMTGAYVASGLIGSLRRSASSEISSSIDPIYP
jgi:hypothetical protein